MKLNTLFSASVLSLAIASTAMAEVTIPNTFSSGQAATAASVNANFTAVADGVNTNETAIAALLARIEVLEAAVPAATYEDRIAGSTYQLSWTYHGYFGEDDGAGSMMNYMRFMMGGGSSMITLHADGTITELNASESEAEGSTFLYPSSEDPDSYQYNQMDSYTDSWQDSGTWTVDEATGIVTVTWIFEEDGVMVSEDDSFQSSEDGSLFVRQGFEDVIDEGDGKRELESHDVYWVRVPSAD